jgi:hypothetical protein
MDEGRPLHLLPAINALAAARCHLFMDRARSIILGKSELSNYTEWPASSGFERLSKFRLESLSSTVPGSPEELLLVLSGTFHYSSDP